MHFSSPTWGLLFQKKSNANSGFAKSPGQFSGNNSPTREKLVGFCFIVLHFSSLNHALMDQGDKTQKWSYHDFIFAMLSFAKMTTSCNPNYRPIRIIFFGPVRFDLRGVYCITKSYVLDTTDTKTYSFLLPVYVPCCSNIISDICN